MLCDPCTFTYLIAILILSIVDAHLYLNISKTCNVEKGPSVVVTNKANVFDFKSLQSSLVNAR